MSVVNIPVWLKLSVYLHVEKYDRDGGHDDPRIRIEFRDVPEPLMHEAMFAQMPCVACGRPINPLRRREGDINRLYYACCCPVTVRVKCSRGAAAAAEYDTFKERWAVILKDPKQLTLF
ncbi:MAG TPA: hypothetical protein VGM94_00740 [Galbitalea sp.]|jgi:hypothetical protein